MKDIRYGTTHTHLVANREREREIERQRERETEREREREIALSRIQLSFLSFILSPLKFIIKPVRLLCNIFFLPLITNVKLLLLVLSHSQRKYVYKPFKFSFK